MIASHVKPFCGVLRLTRTCVAATANPSLLPSGSSSAHRATLTKLYFAWDEVAKLIYKGFSFRFI